MVVVIDHCGVFRKYCMVFINPSSRDVVGFQSNVVFAKEISGFLCFGSSAGSGLNFIVLPLCVSAITFSANSFMVNSVGLPKFTGPVKPLESIIFTIPRRR